MDAHQRRLAVSDRPFSRPRLLRARHRPGRDGRPKPVDAEGAELRGKIRFGHFFEPRRGGIIHDALWGTLNPSIIMASGTECCEGYLVSLLVKLAAMAAIASVLARSNRFKAMLMRENRTLGQRLELAMWLCVVFGASVAVRVAGPTPTTAPTWAWRAACSPASWAATSPAWFPESLISLPALFPGRELLTMPLLAGIGVLGGLLRDLAPDPEEIWRFSPFFDLNIYRFFKESRNYRRTAFHLLLFAAILCAEFLRQSLAQSNLGRDAGASVFRLYPPGIGPFPDLGGALPHHRCSPSPFR